jgi:hypothetical protein
MAKRKENDKSSTRERSIAESFKRITEAAAQRPFRPFAVETVGGTWIDIEREADILVRNQPARIVIFDSAGRMYVFGSEQISAIERR